MPNFGMKSKYSTKVHWNASVLCAIAVETTGEVSGHHDLIDFSLIPLDAHIQISKEIGMINFMMTEKRPENRNPKFPRKKILATKLNGLDPYVAAERFAEWFDKLGLAFGKKLLPLAYRWHKIEPFLIDWLGPLTYNHIFSSQARDVGIVTHFENDVESTRGEACRFPKLDFTSLCRQFKIGRVRPIETIQDAAHVAEIYKRLVESHF